MIISYEVLYTYEHVLMSSVNFCITMFFFIDNIKSFSYGVMHIYLSKIYILIFYTDKEIISFIKKKHFDDMPDVNNIFNDMNILRWIGILTILFIFTQTIVLILSWIVFLITQNDTLFILIISFMYISMVSTIIIPILLGHLEVLVKHTEVLVKHSATFENQKTIFQSSLNDVNKFWLLTIILLLPQIQTIIIAYMKQSIL